MQKKLLDKDDALVNKTAYNFTVFAHATQGQHSESVNIDELEKDYEKAILSVKNPDKEVKKDMKISVQQEDEDDEDDMPEAQDESQAHLKILEEDLNIVERRKND